MRLGGYVGVWGGGGTTISQFGDFIPPNYVATQFMSEMCRIKRNKMISLFLPVQTFIKKPGEGARYKDLIKKQHKEHQTDPEDNRIFFFF